MKIKKIFSITLLIFICSVMLVGCGAPQPSVKEGRFNFSVTYEVDGQVNTISSVFVCKFVKSGRALYGYYIKWDSYIEDSEIESLFPENYYNCIVVETNEDGTIYLDLDLHAEYFMAEPAYVDSMNYAPNLFIKYNETLVEEKGYENSDPMVIASYGVRIISYNYDKPIKNSYK